VRWILPFGCIAAGSDAIKFRIKYYDTISPFDSAFLITGVSAQGSFDLLTNVTCTGTAPDSSAIFGTGLNPEAIKTAGGPPYPTIQNTSVPSTTLQRYIVSGSDSMKVVDSNGAEIISADIFGASYGVLYLQHSTTGDFFAAIGPTGQRLCSLVPNPYLSNRIPSLVTPVFARSAGFHAELTPSCRL
jgi:hypothetical protein